MLKRTSADGLLVGDREALRMQHRFFLPGSASPQAKIIGANNLYAVIARRLVQLLAFWVVR